MSLIRKAHCKIMVAVGGEAEGGIRSRYNSYKNCLWQEQAQDERHRRKPLEVILEFANSHVGGDCKDNRL